MKKIKFIELNYHYHSELSNPEAVIEKHKPSNLFAEELKNKADVLLVKHMSKEGELEKSEIRYRFFHRRNSFWQIPRATHRFIAAQQPDMVLVQGFIFPLQVVALRKLLGKQTVIVLQHHGEVPFKRKRIFQRIADKSVNGYLFSTTELARPWIEKGIIKNTGKCFELPPASTTFLKQDKNQCRRLTGMNSGTNFLWAGRLNANKDPITVLTALEKYFALYPDASLYMIYQENDLLEEVKKRIENSTLLKERVRLIGHIEYSKMETWYSAADYIISASHHEGGSYVLMEAVACGCVPVVSHIPASIKSIDNGRLGYSFEKGDPESLYTVLASLNDASQQEKATACMEYFNKELSAAAIADKILAIYNWLQFK